MARALEANTTLTQLDLGRNSIGDEGATQVARALKANSTLTQLHLAENGIGAGGAMQVARALEANTTLMQLNLAVNGIGDEGATQVARALEANTTLMELDLGGNRISAACVRELAAAIGRNKQRKDHSESEQKEGAATVVVAARANNKEGDSDCDDELDSKNPWTREKAKARSVPGAELDPDSDLNDHFQVFDEIKDEEGKDMGRGVRYIGKNNIPSGVDLLEYTGVERMNVPPGEENSYMYVTYRDVTFMQTCHLFFSLSSFFIFHFFGNGRGWHTSCQIVLGAFLECSWNVLGLCLPSLALPSFMFSCRY